jgi:hypothetical protein
MKISQRDVRNKTRWTKKDVNAGITNGTDSDKDYLLE